MRWKTPWLPHALQPQLAAALPVPVATSASGSAYDIAGQGIANPTAMLMSVAMMLDWLAERQAKPVSWAGVVLVLSVWSAVAWVVWRYVALL